MKSKASSHSIDASYSIDWVEEIIDKIRLDIYAGLVERATGKDKVARYKIDRTAYPNIVYDGRIEIPNDREKLLERCLMLLVDCAEPVITEENIALFLQMNFKGFGDKPNKRVKLKYKMKSTHLMYFFRLVFNRVFANNDSNEAMQSFRKAVVKSFAGYDVKPETIVAYFHKKRPAVERVYATNIKNIAVEHR